MTARPPIYRGELPRGISCPSCGGKTRVTHTRPRPDGSVWRRHACRTCGDAITTSERVTDYRKAS